MEVFYKEIIRLMATAKSQDDLFEVTLLMMDYYKSGLITMDEAKNINEVKGLLQMKMIQEGIL